MPPNKSQYGNYKQFEPNSQMLNNYPKNWKWEWEKDFVKKLNKQSPFKTKVIRRNLKNLLSQKI